MNRKKRECSEKWKACREIIWIEFPWLVRLIRVQSSLKDSQLLLNGQCDKWTGPGLKSRTGARGTDLHLNTSAGREQFVDA